MALKVREETFESLADGWCELFREAPAVNVFLSHTWQRVWWDQFADDAELRLFSFWLDGRLVGLSPLMQRNRTISFLGDTDLVDYHDFLLHRVEPREFIDALFAELACCDSWEKVDLISLPGWSPVLPEIPGAASRRGWSVEVALEDVAPGLQLAESWEEYLAGLGKKKRHELRRKMRRLNAAGTVSQEVYTSPDDVSEHLDDFVRLHRMSTPEKAAFLTPQREAFFRSIGVELAGLGMARLYFLVLNGNPVATSLCFECARSRLIYNSGFDPEYRSLSVGLVNHAMLLQRSMTEGIRFIDFLRGNERYKYDLGATDRTLHHIVITR